MGLAWLVSESVGTEIGWSVALLGSAAIAPLTAIWIVGSGVWVLRAQSAEARGRRIETALLLPCALAPLGVIAPWVVAPSHVGVGLGNFGFFLHWLTRYPNFGPVNGEVLLGIGAVLGASAMPSFLAAHAWLARTPFARTTVVLVLLHLLAYVPVLVRLDVDLLSYAHLVATDGPVSLVSQSFAPSGWNALSAAGIAGGAILRAFTALCAITLAVRRAS